MDASLVYGAGLSVGVVMLAMTVTGLLDGLARVVPRFRLSLGGGQREQNSPGE